MSSRPSRFLAPERMLTPVRDEAASEEFTGFAGAASSAYSTMTAHPGATLAIFGALALLGGGSSPRRRYRRVWRKKARSQMSGKQGGRTALRKDQRPSMFGPEKPPHEAKRMYSYYCNKMYKVIREAVPSTVIETPVETEVAKEEFVAPALWNSQTFRACAIAGGGAVAGAGLPFASLLHLCSYGIWLGANVWTTFVAGITMYKNLPKQTFGKLQAKLFPKYFQMGAACSAALVLTSMRLGLPIAPALISLVGTLSNLFYLEPEATKVMFERYDREDKGIKEPAVDKDLKARFGKLHGLSSLANLLTLVGLVAHGTLLAARL